MNSREKTDSLPSGTVENRRATAVVTGIGARNYSTGDQSAAVTDGARGAAEVTGGRGCAASTPSTTKVNSSIVDRYVIVPFRALF